MSFLRRQESIFFVIPAQAGIHLLCHSCAGRNPSSLSFLRRQESIFPFFPLSLPINLPSVFHCRTFAASLTSKWPPGQLHLPGDRDKPQPDDDWDFWILVLFIFSRRLFSITKSTQVLITCGSAPRPRILNFSSATFCIQAIWSAWNCVFTKFWSFIPAKPLQRLICLRSLQEAYPIFREKQLKNCKNCKEIKEMFICKL